MSEWYKAKKEDIDISSDNKTLEINFASNDCGNSYVEIEITDVLSLLLTREDSI